MYEIIYNGETIKYDVIKSKIKNMYIHIKEGNVIVKVPMRLNEKYIHEFVNKKSKWIYEKTKQQSRKKEEKIETKDIERLKKVVEYSIEKYCKKLNLKPNNVKIKDIKYAWGSCSSKKNITINLKLATKEDRVIEYVVLHELCHLKYMNHSKLFWNLVEENMQEYKKYKNKLKE